MSTGKQQDIKFVEWSEETDENSFDLRWISAHINKNRPRPQILDIGGGTGKCAAIISKKVTGAHVDVVDSSPLAKEHFTESPSSTLLFGNFLEMPLKTKYDFIMIRTVLHHMVGRTERENVERQIATLEKAKTLLARGGSIFITETFYMPMVGNDLTGRLIFEFTKLQTIGPVPVSGLTRRLGANTAGEGVRFRSEAAWRSMLARVGLQEVEGHTDATWGRSMPVWQMVPLLCRKRFKRVLRCVIGPA